MNNVNLIGRLSADVKVSVNGKTRCWFTLAVSRPGSDDADFVPVVCFERLADAVIEYTGKGHLVAVEGRLHTSSYDQDGQSVYRTEVIARRVQFLKAPGPNTAESVDEDETEEPF